MHSCIYNQASRELSTEACYCSIYDDGWQAELNNPDPKSVESCD